MDQLIKTLAEDTAIATGAFAQSTVVPIDNEPTPRLMVEPPLRRSVGPRRRLHPVPGGEPAHPARGWGGRTERVSARWSSAHHGR